MPRSEFCSKTSHLRKMLATGRNVAARQQAAAWLREGYVSPQFLALVADMVDPSKRGKGSRPRALPPQWLDIGQALLTIRDDGFTQEQAILILADRFNRSARAIEQALAFYQKAHDKPEVAPPRAHAVDLAPSTGKPSQTSRPQTQRATGGHG